MFTEKRKSTKPKKPSKERLRHIALHYLERFESSEDSLRNVLRRRIDKYVFFDKDYNPDIAYQWVEDVVSECLKHNFVNDERFAEFKIRDYLNAGKPRRYIEQKLKQKGIDEKIISHFFEENEYSEFEIALNFAKKKKIGPFCKDTSLRTANRQKDLGTLVRAGFNFDIAKEILNYEDF